MKRSALLCAAMLVAACDTPTAPRAPASADALSAAVVRNDRFERQTIAINDCNGEIIAIDATFHVLVTVTNNAAGGYHVTIHRNLSGTATNIATGAEYVVNQVDNNNYTVGRGADEQTYIINFTLIGKGQVPNEVAQVNYHLTITPDGDVTSYHDGFRVKCGD